MQEQSPSWSTITASSSKAGSAVLVACAVALSACSDALPAFGREASGAPEQVAGEEPSGPEAGEQDDRGDSSESSTPVAVASDLGGANESSAPPPSQTPPVEGTVRTAFDVRFELKECVREGDTTLSCELILSSLGREQYVFLPTSGTQFSCRPWTKNTRTIDEFGSENVVSHLRIGDDVYEECGRTQPLVPGFRTSAFFVFTGFSGRANRIQKIEISAMVGGSIDDLQAADLAFTAIDIGAAATR